MSTKKTKPKLRAGADDERRTVCVSVRLSTSEARELDTKRGKVQRGTYLRLVLQNTLPSKIPALNAQAYSELARLAANLNQLVTLIRCDTLTPDIRQVYILLQNLRQKIIGAATKGGKKSDEV